jgi:hypothetical protein
MERQHGWDDELVRDAIVVLQDMVLWQMAPPRWTKIAGKLDRLDAALAAGDPVVLRQAVTDLQISGPVRITRIGTKTVTGVPKPVLDLRNTLVHKLTAEARSAPEDGRADRPAR